jgi:hypothetical protein
MSKSIARKFQLADAMILVAATALACTALRSQWPFGIPSLFAYTGPKKSINNMLLNLNITIFDLAKLAASLTVACLVLWLRQPWPALRHLARRPGMVACTTATFVLTIRLINHFIVIGILAVDGIYPVIGLSAMDINELEWRRFPSEIGCAVAAAWFVQRISKRWCCEPTWLDRTGRILGSFWVGTIPFSWFTNVYS